jgi:hypothetical protein
VTNGGSGPPPPCFCRCLASLSAAQASQGGAPQALELQSPLARRHGQGDCGSAPWGVFPFFLLCLRRASSIQQVGSPSLPRAPALIGYPLSFFPASHGSPGLQSLSFSSSSPRLPSLDFSFQISEEYLCVLRPRSKDEWPCSVGEEGTGCNCVCVCVPPRSSEGHGCLFSQKKGSLSSSFSTPLSDEPCFHDSTSISFRFLGLLFARL